MAKERDRERGRRSKRTRHRTSSSSSSSPSRSPSASSDYTSSSQSPERDSRESKHKRSSSRRHRESSRSHRKDRKSSRKSSHRKDRRERSKKRSHRRRDEDSSDYSSREEDNVMEKMSEPKEVVKSILDEFPAVATDLHQILQMIDNGQGVDLSGLSDKSLVKLLKKLFITLNLEKNRSGVYMLPPKASPCLDIVGPTVDEYINTKHASDGEHLKDIKDDHLENSKDDKLVDSNDEQLVNPKHAPNEEQENQPAPKKRMIGPAMPSRELLEAAAELTEAAGMLREAEVGEENEVLIGPPPPALVSEAESANDAERFEEVARIMAAGADSPYDVLGINWKMASENIKKKYWKLSLLVHPDKCLHPQAKEAFVILNKAFKDLQDPNKRGAIDDKLKAKEEQERFEVELKAMREAAQWRKIQGILMEGDEELLAGPKEPPKREEWMTTLPPERKPGMPMHSTTSFSKSGKEGRGDTSAWTDTPLDKANKAKQHYLEAYDKAKALADAEEARSQAKPTTDASLVDKYNSSKRSKSLVEKHMEEKTKERKSKKERSGKEKEQQEWEGNHPWKPWDREKDLTAGRKNVNLDPKNMSQGLTSRFSGGTTQRNFL